MRASSIQTLALALICLFASACEFSTTKPEQPPRVTLEVLRLRAVSRSHKFACQLKTPTDKADSSVMWAQFRVPETRFFEYLGRPRHHENELTIGLTLSNGDKFDQPGTIGEIEDTDANVKNGYIPVRADFPNPGGRLRDGQIGDVSLRRELSDVMAIPQQSAISMDGKYYVYVVDDNDVAHKREFTIQTEFEDVFIVKSGIDVGEKIVIKSFPRVRDGVKVEYLKPTTELPGLQKRG